MGLIVAERYLYPAILPEFVRMADLTDPRLASDHYAIAKIVLAIETVLGVNPMGRHSTLLARVRNAMKVQLRIETHPNTGAAGANWRDGVTVNWTSAAPGLSSPPVPLFTAPPVVLCTYRGTIADNNTPAIFWIASQDPTGSASVIKARAKNGSALTGTSPSHAVSVLGIGLVEAAE